MNKKKILALTWVMSVAIAAIVLTSSRPKADTITTGGGGLSKVTTNSPGLLAGSGTTTNPLTATITQGSGLAGTGSSGNELRVGATVDRGLVVDADSIGVQTCGSAFNGLAWDWFTSTWSCGSFATGGGTIAGTTNTTAKFTSSTNIGNAWPTDDGTTWGVTSKFTITEASGNFRTFGTATVDGVSTLTGLVTATAGGTTSGNWTTTGTGDLVSADDLTVADDALISDALHVVGAGQFDSTLNSTGNLTEATIRVATLAGAGMTKTGGTFDVIATTGGGLVTAADSVGMLTTCSTDNVLAWTGTAWACASGTVNSIVGTTNTTAKFTGTNTVGNGWALDDGTSWGVSGKFLITEASGNTVISGTTTSTGLITATAGGTTTANWTTTGAGDLVSGDDLTVADDATISDILAVTGVSNLTGLVTATAGGTTGNNWTTTGTGDLVSADDLTVADDATVSDTLHVVGVVTADTTSTLTGLVTATAGITTGNNYTTTGTGDVVSADDVTATDDLFVLDDSNLGNDSTDLTTLTGTLTANATAGSIGQILYINGSTLPAWGSLATAGVAAGTGTSNTVTKWTGTSTIGNSSITDDGTTVQVSADLQTAVGKMATFQGSQQISVFNYNSGALETTYIRGGKNASAINIGDVNTGGVNIGAAGNATQVTGAVSVLGNTALGNATSDTTTILGATSITGVQTANGLTTSIVASAATGSPAVIIATNSGTYATGASPLIAYGASFNSTATRVSGANTLTNIAVYAESSGGQASYSWYGATGSFYNAAAGTFGATLAINGNTSIGDATTDAHISYGTVTMYEDTGATFGTIDGNASAQILDLTSLAAGVGGGISFGGKYTSGGLTANGAAIKAMKTNATDGNYSWDLAFGARSNGSALAEYMRITSLGSVGVGSASPLAQMHVYGDAQDTAAVTDAGQRGGMLRLSSPDATADSGGIIAFAAAQSDSANSVGFAAIKGGLTDGTTNTKGYISFSNRNVAGDTSLTERMRIDPNGSVGIGDTTPDYLLDVAGSLGVDGNAAIGDAVSDSHAALGTFSFSEDGGTTFTATAANTIELRDTTSQALGVGGGIVFYGNYTGTTPAIAGAIKAMKVSSTDSAAGFDLVLGGRGSGDSDVAERLRLGGEGTATLTGNYTVTGNTILGDATGDTLTISGNTTASAGYVAALFHTGKLGAAPSVGTCGTSPVQPSTNSTNSGGNFTTGATTGTSCTLTFNGTWPATPVCFVWLAAAGTGKSLIVPTTLTTTTMTMTTQLTSSTAYQYACPGTI